MESIALTAQGLRLRHLSDEAVLTRTLSGDSIAFGELHRRFRRRIEGFCASRVNAEVTADDATQETFLRVLRAAPQTVANAEAWLFTVARNACNDLMRKAQRFEGLVEQEEEFSFADLPVADTATELMRRQTARSVFLALRRMPTRYRSAIILREFHGMSSAEIAETMGISRGAVDPLVSRARDAFGVAYAEVSGFPEACRAAVELIYRDLGSGIEASERAALDAHLHACPRCSEELKRANSPRYQHALAPLLVLTAPKWNVFRQALEHAAVSPGILNGASAVPTAAVATAVSIAVIVGSIGLSSSSRPTYQEDLDGLARGTTASVAMPRNEGGKSPGAASDSKSGHMYWGPSSMDGGMLTEGTTQRQGMVGGSGAMLGDGAGGTAAGGAGVSTGSSGAGAGAGTGAQAGTGSGTTGGPTSGSGAGGTTASGGSGAGSGSSGGTSGTGGGTPSGSGTGSDTGGSGGTGSDTSGSGGSGSGTGADGGSGTSGGGGSGAGQGF